MSVFINVEKTKMVYKKKKKKKKDCGKGKKPKILIAIFSSKAFLDVFHISCAKSIGFCFAMLSFSWCFFGAKTGLCHSIKIAPAST